VVLDFANRTGWPHGMHIHGHHFRIIARDGKPVSNGPWRDTELVEANEAVTVAFVADNPGKWLIHCHMLEHQAAGMKTWFEVVG
jgi:FtsP/CotA-like multicopper oxidase with cupredoxin domain